jgi:hypothetical protein
VGGRLPARPSRPSRVRVATALGLSAVLSTALVATANAAATTPAAAKTASGSSAGQWLSTSPKPANPAHPGQPVASPDTAKPPAQSDPQAALHQAMVNAVAKAKKVNAPVPVDTMTDGYSQTVANADGSFSYSQSVAPVRAKKNNTWVPVDTNLVKASDGTWQPNAAAVSLSLSNGGKVPLAVLDDNAGHSETLTWPTSLPTPQINGNSALYPEVFPGVDLRVAVDSLGFHEVLIVKSAQAAANAALAKLHFGLTTKNLTVSVDAGGQLRSTDAKGATVFAGGTPGMWDTAPTPAVTAQARAEANAQAAPAPNPADGPFPDAQQSPMKATLASGGIDVATNTAMLASPKTHYPVYIDPDNAVQALIAHAEIWQGLPTRPGDPTACCNENVTRVGWSTDSPGAVRALFQFTNKIPWMATIGESDFKLTTETGTTKPVNTEVWQLDQFPTDSNGHPTGSLMNWNSATGSGGAWTPFDTNVHSIGNFTMGGTGAAYTATVKNTAQVQTIVNNNGPYVTLGVKAATETTAAGGWQTFWWNSPNLASQNATLSISYRLPPWITRLWTSPGTISGTTCDTNQTTPGYITKTVGGKINVNVGVADLDPLSVPVDVELDDLDGGRTTSYAYQWTPPANAPGGGGEALTNATFSQAGDGPTGTQSWALTDGHRYELFASPNDNNTQYSPVTPVGPKCYFTVAFTSPDPPGVASTDFPAIGGTPAKLATAPGAFQITGTTKGVAIAGFQYVINGDPSAVQAANLPNPGPDTTSGAGYVSADSSGRAAINLPQGATQMGTNSLLVRAIDVAGNTSPFTSWDFFTPGNPDLKAAYGNVTGDGMADIVATAPDGSVGGAQHLVVFPSTVDPNPANANNATEAAPASAAPDGSSWANTLFTHRGADRASPTDDLFAYSQKTHQLFYYLNAVVRKSGALPADQFSQTHQVLISRPACTSSPQACSHYPSDWSKVLNIVALGPVAGGNAGTFGGKTSFITVEDDGNGGGDLWLFSPGPAAGQLKNPQLIGTSDLSRHTTLMPDGWNWATVNLIAPGSATVGGLPDLWARDPSTGNLIQFTNATNAAGAEDPTSLGNLDAAVRVGNQGQFSTNDYPTLISGGAPAVDGSNGTVPAGSTAGNSHETGPRALWSLGSNGQLALVPGPITAGSTLSHNLWRTTADSWAGTTRLSAVNDAQVGPTTGPVMLGIDQNSGTQMCLDLAGGTTSDGTMVRSWGCNGSPAQVWNFNTNGTITSSIDPTKCVDIIDTPVTSNGTMNQTPVQLWGCNGGTNQQWTLRTSVSATNANLPGWLNLYNPNSGRCMDNPYDNTGWQQLWIFNCLDNQAQQWLTPAPAGSPQKVEAEDLWIENASPTPTVQTNCCGMNWSNGGQVWFQATGANQSFTLDWNVPESGTYVVNPTMTRAANYGITQLAIDNGPALPNQLDGYQASGVSAAPFDFGKATLSAGPHKFTFTVTGTDPASTGSRFMAGVDTLDLTPVIGVGPTASMTLTTTSGTTPLAVTADASASNGGGANVTSYAFDFGDGSTATTGTATTATHTYTTAGTYLASVTLTDSAGNTAVTRSTVTATSVPTSLSSSDGTTSAPCATSAASAATMASLTPVLSTNVATSQTAQFELRDLTDPSLAPPIAIGGTGSAGSSGPVSTVTAPTLVNGHEYAFAARASAASGVISPISPTCYFWALTSGTQATATGATGLPFDNTLYPAASPQTWAGPLTTLKWANGNLALYRNNDNALLWGATTPGASNVLALQNDGNMVIYSSQPTVNSAGWLSGTPVWNTNTSGQGATSALVANDGSFTVRKGTAVLWNAPTASHAWSLSDGQGLAAADKGFVGGSPATLDTAGVSWPGGSYVTFAGTTARIATAGPVVDTTKSFSVSAWVNLAATGGGTQTMLVQQGNTNSAFYLEYNGTNWQFAMPTTDNSTPAFTRITSTNPAAAGAWTHLIATYDSTSGRMALYVNGTPNSSGTIANSIASTNPLAMGRGFIGGTVNNRFQGSMADVRVFPQTVSDSQATSVYQSSSFAKPAVPGIAGPLISGNSPTGDQICLDDLNGSLANTTTVIDVYGCNGTWPQAWQFAADGTLRLMGANPAAPPNKCLDTGGGNAQGSKVTLFDCQAGNGNQQWKAVPSTSTPGQFSLQNPPTGLCLDNSGGATGNTNPFQLYGCLDNANQHFTLPTAAGQNQKAEAESLWGSATGGTMQTQTGGEYSNGAQQYLGSTAAGSSMTVNLYVANPGRYAVTPLMTMAADYGTVTVSVDGAAALPLTFDGYGSGITTKQFDFGGAVNLTAGMHSFTFTATGTNAASTGNRYNIGVDTLLLQPTAR